MGNFSIRCFLLLLLFQFGGQLQATSLHKSISDNLSNHTSQNHQSQISKSGIKELGYNFQNELILDEKFDEKEEEEEVSHEFKGWTKGGLSQDWETITNEFSSSSKSNFSATYTPTYQFSSCKKFIFFGVYRI